VVYVDLDVCLVREFELYMHCSYYYFINFLALVFHLIVVGTKTRINNLQILAMNFAQQSNSMRKPIQEMGAKEVGLEAQRLG